MATEAQKHSDTRPRFRMRRGLKENLPNATFTPFEPVYVKDTKTLMIADEKGELHVVAQVVEGPHDQNLYAKIEGRADYLPLCVRGPHWPC